MNAFVTGGVVDGADGQIYAAFQQGFPGAAQYFCFDGDLNARLYGVECFERIDHDAVRDTVVQSDAQARFPTGCQLLCVQLSTNSILLRTQSSVQLIAPAILVVCSCPAFGDTNVGSPKICF